ncbi:hypothetical protein GIB67_003495 [Kingdonia uniflora]|uniref:Adenylate isopentenyltransferase n=1 Tax=Kingdonia uniflora TaxID=39325 RepID=A0A7J7MEI5_9MAGN|nr:hypothetical protein GIB67_003495 [Kingdonia uniflora]
MSPRASAQSELYMDLPPPQWSEKSEKMVVVMGATGVGKSNLSIKLATQFSPAEILNCDKMQVYRGLDITTNKVPIEEQLGVPHHFLDQFDHTRGELSPHDYRSLGRSTLEEILSRGTLPIVVGGSNSFIDALVSDQYIVDPYVYWLESVSPKLSYNCCFLWVDVSLPVLYEYLDMRLDEMLQRGMFSELCEFYKFKYDNKYNNKSDSYVGIEKSIGVPEFEEYFHRFPPSRQLKSLEEKNLREMHFKKAVRAAKNNTCKLAKEQVGKIKLLRSIGWDIRRLDATETIKAILASDYSSSAKMWEKDVFEPSVKIVNKFLELD